MKQLIYFLFPVIALVSCTDDYEGEIPDYETEYVVEAYVNQLYPQLNYALVSKSIDYFNPDTDVSGISDVQVKLFEGVLEEGDTSWSEPDLWSEFPLLPGIYVPSDPNFVGVEGNVYRLEVTVDGTKLSSTAYLPPLVPIDSFYWIDRYNLQKDTVEPFAVMNFTDPSSFGNHYLLVDYRNKATDLPTLWGSTDRLLVGDDLLFNGERFSYSEIFPDEYGDTINIFLNSINEEASRYWVSYENAQNNGGPFSQPINVESTFEGGIGVFTAMAVDHRKLIITKP